MMGESNFQVLKDKIDLLNKRAWEERVKDSTQAHVDGSVRMIVGE